MRWPRSQGCVAPPPRCLTCSRQKGKVCGYRSPRHRPPSRVGPVRPWGLSSPPILQHEPDDEGKSRSVRFPRPGRLCPPECCPLANAELCKPQARLQFGQFFSLPASLARAPSDRQSSGTSRATPASTFARMSGVLRIRGRRGNAAVAFSQALPDASRSPISDLVCKRMPKEKLACLVRPLRSSCSSVSVDQGIRAISVCR